ncbi:MAG: hypothetical protein ABI599_10945 [Flavobacteriales bacterium]
MRTQPIQSATEVLVFKTSVSHRTDVEQLRPLLDRTLAGFARWNFDLEDRDRILRVENGAPARHELITVMRNSGYECVELE